MDDDPPPASPAEAVVALLIHQSFTPGGLIRRLGVTSGPAGPLAAAAVFLPQGETLFETLLLNLCPPYRSEGDQPIWERGPYRVTDVEGGKAQAMLSGRTRIYTWMSRAVRLLPDDDGRIRWITSGPGVRPQPGPDLDPMCAYSKTDGALRPYRLSLERSFWRDFEALLPNRSGWSAPPVLNHAREFLRATERPSMLFPLVIAGQITDQAKVLSVRRETYPLSAHTLDPDVAGRILDAVACAEETYGVLNKAARGLARCLLSPPEDIHRFIRSLPLHSVYWSDLERQFPRFLEMLARDDPDAALRDWEERVYRSAWTAWSVTANAVGTTPRHRAALARAELFLRVKSGGTGT
jgi:CRISPR system Cascade subunit CasA